MDAVVGLAGFVILLVMWVILPHRVLHRRRIAPAPGPKAAAQPAVRRRHRGSNRAVTGIRLERASMRGNGASPYCVAIDLVGGDRRTARVPVHRVLTDTGRVHLRERYWAEIAGVRVQAGNLPALAAAVRETLGWLLDGQRLPHYWLSGPGGPAVPVFVREGRYLARVRGGPEFAASELSTVRARVAHYLGSPDLQITGLSVADLRFCRPVAMLTGPQIWMPVWPEAGVVGAGDGAGLVAADVAALLALRAQVAAALLGAGRLPSGAQLAVEFVSMDPARLAEVAAPADASLALPDAGGRTRQRFAVLRCGPEVGCLIGRRLLLAEDLWGLAGAVGMELERSGRGRAEDVRVLRETAAGEPVRKG